MKALSPQQWSAHEINVTISTNNFILVQLSNCLEPIYTPVRVQAQISCLYRILPAYRTITLYISHVMSQGARHSQKSCTVSCKIVTSLYTGSASCVHLPVPKLVKLDNNNAKQKHLGCKKGEANQKQQLSDYKSIHSYTCD